MIKIIVSSFTYSSLIWFYTNEIWKSKHRNDKWYKIQPMIINKITGLVICIKNNLNMRPHKSPPTKSNNIYKSSTMLKKVSPQ